MNDWPADPELDIELRRLVNAELAAAAENGTSRRRQSRGSNSRAFASLGLLAVVVIVASLVLRAQSNPGPAGPSGPATVEATETPSSPSATPTVGPTSTPTAGPTGNPAYVPTYKMVCWRYRSMAVALLGGRVLIIGGCEGSTPQEDNSAELFDPRTSKFSPTGSTTASHDAYGSAILLEDGRVLIAGGSAGEPGQNGREAELYDPGTGTFRPTGSMTAIRANASATLLQDGRVLFAGGSAGEPGQNGREAELYDPGTGTFSRTGSMIDAPSIFFGSALLPDGRVLFVGSDQPASQTMAELYDPRTGTFSRTGSMIDAHPNGLGSALLPDGRVLIAGGDDQGTAELYDPGTGTFSRTGSMTQALDVMSCTTLLDGRVLFTGSAVSLTSQSSAGPAGKGTGFALVDFRRGSSQAQQRPPVFALVPETMLAQVYDPKSGKFSAAAPMIEPRGEYTAALLPDGRVLIAGGETDIAELFDPATGKFELNGG